MSDFAASATVRSAQSFLERFLAEGFAKLDAQTGDVGTRKALYAMFIETAIALADARLPHNN